jgi:hypothetical protein
MSRKWTCGEGESLMMLKERVTCYTSDGAGAGTEGELRRDERWAPAMTRSVG